jgi:anaerobic ribonucleoside-triphosphate reductase activating protein
MMKVRVAGIIPESIVDGPGIRLALFVQGCLHRCPGCHNRAARDPAGGVEMNAAEILAQVRAARDRGGIDGVTFSGGEPFEQAAALAGLAGAIVSLGLNLVLYSGYTFEELLQMSRGSAAVRRLLEAGTILVDGPFVEAERDLTLPYRGSKNQRLLDLPRSLERGSPVEWQNKFIRCQTPE